MKEYIENISWPVILAFFGAFLAAIGALWSSVNQAQESRENSNLYKQLAAKSDEVANNSKQYAAKVDSYAKRQSQSDDEVIALQKQLLEKNVAQQRKTEEIATLSIKLNETQEKLNKELEKTNSTTSESLKYLTGGDSYCFISMAGFDEAKDNVRVKLFHHGKYPLSALRVTITRTSAISRQSEKTGYYPRMLSGVHQVTFPVGPLPSSSEPYPYELGTVAFTPKILETYYIQFFAQNGIWTQKYSITYGQAGNMIVESKLFVNQKEIELGFNGPKYGS